MDIIKKLSKTQEEILDLINSGDYTIGDIANTRQTSISYIYKVIRQLNKIGWDIDTKKIGSKKGTPINQKTKNKEKFWRYHNLHFIIKPYPKYPRYKRHIGTLEIRKGAWLISIHKEIIEVQQRQNYFIKDLDVWECIRRTRDDFNKTLAFAGSYYGFEFNKEKRSSIKCVNGHLAQEKGDLAYNCKDRHLLIKGDDDKIWFEIDESFEREEEYRHPKHHISDKVIVGRHLNAFRNNPECLTVPEIEKRYVDAFDLIHKYSKAIEMHLDVEERKLETEMRTQQTLENMNKLLERLNISNPIKVKEISYSALLELKSMIKEKTDVLKFSELVDKLTTEDKYLLTEWMCERFD